MCNIIEKSICLLDLVEKIMELKRKHTGDQGDGTGDISVFAEDIAGLYNRS